jgi:hypothetical protein
MVFELETGALPRAGALVKYSPEFTALAWGGVKNRKSPATQDTEFTE